MRNEFAMTASSFRAPSLAMPVCYLLIIGGGSLDLLLTDVILSLGGREANPLANVALQRFGMTGMAAYKCLVTALIILGCEYTARRRLRTGRRLAHALIAINFAPVVWSTSLLARHFA